jgi:regulatory protein
MSTDPTNTEPDRSNVIAIPGGRDSAPASTADALPTAAEKAERLARLRTKIAEVEVEAESEPSGQPADPAPAASAPPSNVTALPEPADEASAPSADELLDDAVTRLTKWLARSPKSERECDAYLVEQTELDASQRAEVLERMRGYGYLDDARLAEQLVNGRLARKGLGKAGMARELRQRGLDTETIDDALDESDASEFDTALELANKRARSLQDLEPEVARRRLYGYLGRRGFSGAVVSQVVDLALQPQRRSGPYFK